MEGGARARIGGKGRVRAKASRARARIGRVRAKASRARARIGRVRAKASRARARARIGGQARS